MSEGARTPEELMMLLEDAFVLGDADAVARLFEEGAILVPGVEGRDARGRAEIKRLVGLLRQQRRTYLADVRRVVQAGDTAVVLADLGVSVQRRGPHGEWRFVIALLSFVRAEPAAS